MVGSIQAAVSGLQANQKRVDVAARNIANVNTPGYEKQVLDVTEGADGGVVATARQPAAAAPPTAGRELPPSNVDLTEEIPALNVSKGLYQANLAVVRTQDEMLGTLLDRRK